MPFAVASLITVAVPKRPFFSGRPQAACGAARGLPAIIIGAQHDGVFRQIQIEPDDGLRLPGGHGIVGNMRFDPDRRMKGAWFWFRISLASRNIGFAPVPPG